MSRGTPGFTRLTERETRIVDGHDQPLLAFGHDVRGLPPQ
jgi:hypothetical protein